MMSEKKKMVPVLRFPGFSGEWEERKLGDVTSKIGSGKTPHGGKNAYKDYGISLIRSQNVNYGTVNFTDAVYIDDETDEEMKNSRVLNGDVLLNITGASIGRSAVYNGFERANVNQHVCIIRPLSDQISSEFIHINLTSNNGQKQIDSSQAGGAREGLNFQQISKLVFLFPEIDEQERIGSFFKQLDHLITLHQRKLSHLQARKKGLLQKMFPKDGELFPELRFPGFTDAWEERELSEVVTVNSGRDYKHLNIGDIPVYGTGGYMLSVDEALSYDADGIGIGRKGTIDSPYILRAPYWTVDTLFYAIPKKCFDLDFIFTVFQNTNWKKLDESTGVPSLSKAIINKVIRSFPANEEQQKIGAFFKQLDDSITLHQRKLDHLQTRKKALLQQLFV